MEASQRQAIIDQLRERGSQLKRLAASSDPSRVIRMREPDGMRPIPSPYSATIEEADANGVPALMINAGETAERTVIWCHHGGYVLGSAAANVSFGIHLAQAARARVLMLDYRLAPEHRYPCAIEDVLNAYRWLLQKGVSPDLIVLGGASAGGGLALAAILALRQSGDASPAACVALSPLTDLTLSGESYRTRMERDPIASAEVHEMLISLYLGGADPTSPYASPLFGDWSGAPPMLVLVGTEEVLYADAERLVRRAKDVGVDSELLIGSGEFHIWPVYCEALPEARAAVDYVGRYIQTRTSG